MDTLEAIEREKAAATAEKTEISLGFIPQGDFIYPIHVTNSLGKKIDLVLNVFSDGMLVQETFLNFSNHNYYWEFEFTITSEAGSVNTSIVITTEKDNAVKIHFPVSPYKKNKRHFPVIDLYELEGLVSSEINDWESHSQEIRPNTNTPTMHNTGPSMNKRQIESYMQQRYFRGLINLEQAQSQMDFVVYNKLFDPAGYKGFKKWKRSVYRRIVLFLYKRLTRNAARKLYFAKLYRNYVNNNLIAENLHGE